MTRLSVNINPEILRWAREEAGLDYQEVAKKLSVNAEKYLVWEKNGLNIPFGKLQVLSNYFKRQTAVFFLKDVPEKISKPKDFRNLTSSDSKLSKNVLLALRKVHRLQRIANELRGDRFWKEKLNWLSTVDSKKSTDKVLANWLRELLEIDIENQLTWKNESQAYKNWRGAIEDKLGILVFQFSMPLDEVQGFSLIDNKPYVIVTNSKHSYTARIFTMFHELGHILRNESGLCITDNVKKKQVEEWACNSFAGELLVPSDQIIETDQFDDIKRYASRFKVSREVYLRKLKQDHLIKDSIFFDLLDKIKDTYTKENKNGFVSPEVKSRTSRGETFYNLILDAVSSNKLTFSEASSALDLSVNKIIHEF